MHQLINQESQRERERERVILMPSLIESLGFQCNCTISSEITTTTWTCEWELETRLLHHERGTVFHAYQASWNQILTGLAGKWYILLQTWCMHSHTWRIVQEHQSILQMWRSCLYNHHDADILKSCVCVYLFCRQQEGLWRHLNEKWSASQGLRMAKTNMLTTWSTCDTRICQAPQRQDCWNKPVVTSLQWCLLVMRWQQALCCLLSSTSPRIQRSWLHSRYPKKKKSWLAPPPPFCSSSACIIVKKIHHMV